MLVCKLCSTEFAPSSSRHIFCGAKCRELWHGRSDKFRQRQRTWYANKLVSQRERGAVRQQKLKSEMISAYSPSRSCECCGETLLAFLTLDHKNRDGKQDREQFGGSHRLWMSLKKDGWPNRGYRILCMNCNFATRYGRVCPHKGAETNGR